MISSNKGDIQIEGSMITIEADLVVLIHALDVEISKILGKEVSENYLERILKKAFELREVKPDSDGDMREVDNELIRSLKKLDEVINSIISEVDDGK